MKHVLTVDIGTGTQDIFLFREGLDLENGLKLVMPSPTMMVREKIQEATRLGKDILLTGVTMGGGPSHWAAETHLEQGHRVFATPESAKTFNDDLEWVEHEMGVNLISEDEARSQENVQRITLQDFDLEAIRQAFSAFGVKLDLDGVGVAVFDHGAAPANVSDRKFRFDYLERRILEKNHLSAFAYPAEQVPKMLSRMHAVSTSAAGLDCPLVLMDTAPAAVLGATLDPVAAQQARSLIVNIGNMHTLAFRLGPHGIEGVFEHHTGLLDPARLDKLLELFAAGTLKSEDVFNDHGHGALTVIPEPLPLEEDIRLIVTGPRRSMMAESRHKYYFAAPFGDMMLTGCFGVLAAIADIIPSLQEPIHAALSGADSKSTPWDADV
ncbi:MAG: DUF1786 domain-containing protein [Anaerolineales bacterium]